MGRNLGRFMIVILFLLLFLIVFNTAYADQKEKNWGISFIPIIAFSPETDFMFGAITMYYRNPYPENPEQSQNIISSMAACTTRKQFIAGLGIDRYFRGDDFNLSAEFFFSKFPDTFFGIGPGTTEDMKEGFTPFEIDVKGCFMFKLALGLYLGPWTHLLFSDLMEREEGGELDRGDIPGSEGTIISGGGIRVLWDERNHPNYPLSGYLADVKMGLYRQELGSSENFSRIELDYRQFLQLFGEHVLAFQYLLQLTTGTVPLQGLPGLGGAYMMRGYEQGRYRDKDYMAFQAEYRYPLFWKFSGSLFGAVGQVAPSLDAFELNTLKLAGGVGLRFLLSQKQKIKLRTDFAFSKEGFGFYVSIMEAF